MRVPCKRRSRRGPDACHSLMTSPVMLVITRAALWLGRRGSRTHHPDSSRYCNGASSGTRAIATPQCPARAYGLRYETWAAARVSRRQRSLPVLDRATDGGASGLYELPGFTLTGACLATCAGLLCGLVVRACCAGLLCGLVHGAPILGYGEIGCGAPGPIRNQYTVRSLPSHRIVSVLVLSDRRSPSVSAARMAPLMQSVAGEIPSVCPSP